MVIMSIEMFERKEALLDLYTKLAEAEAEEAEGEAGIDFAAYAARLRDEVHGRIQG
jgi:hypothetical protein